MSDVPSKLNKFMKKRPKSNPPKRGKIPTRTAEAKIHAEGDGKILGLLIRGEMWFLAKFFAIFFTLEAAINYFGFSALQNFIASSGAAALGLKSSESLVFVKSGVFDINPSCTGLVSSSILFAIVFSLRKPSTREKATIIIAGAALLLALNYFRVIAVLWTGKEFGVEAAEAVHIASWFSTTVFVLALWYFFTKKITGAKNFSDFM